MTLKPIKEDEWTYLPFEEGQEPKKSGFYNHITDNYWRVHPDKGFLFYKPRGRYGGYKGKYGAPQCNSNEKICIAISTILPTEVGFYASVWVPIDLRDYYD